VRQSVDDTSSILHRRQIHEEDAVCEGSLDRFGRGEREPRLPAPAGAGEGQNAAGAEQLATALDFSSAADEPRPAGG